MLEKLPVSSQLEWIERSVAPLPPPGPGPARVRHFVPPIFEAYAKIRHAVYLDETITDPQLTYDDGDVEPFPIEAFKDEPEKVRILQDLAASSYLLYEPVPVPDGAPRITWAQIAQRYGIVVHEEDDLGHVLTRAGFKSWPRQLIPSGEGWLDAESTEALVECVGRAFGPEPVYFWLPWGANMLAYDGPILYRGQLEDVWAFHIEDDWHLTPEYCWPESRSWCISTDRDTHYSLVGGPGELIGAILGHPRIDGVSVAPSTSLTGFEARPS